MNQSSGYSRELEAARGLAIVLVLILHYVPFYFKRDWVVATFGPLAVIPQSGRTGVILFFVLSAFLLGTPFLREWMGGSSPSLQRFFYRRVLRIFPLFYAAVLVAFLFVGDGIAAIRSLFFLTDRLKLHPFSDVWWSLRTEIQFYALLGASVWLLRWRTTRRWTLGAYALLAAAYLVYVTGRFYGHFAILQSGALDALYSVAFQWPPFFFGGVAAWMYLRWGDAWTDSARRSRFLRNGGGDAVVLVVLLILWAYLASIGDETYMVVLRRWPGWLLGEGVLWSAFVLALVVLPIRTKAVLVNPVMEFMGRISYSLYLVHLPLNSLSAPLRLKLRILAFGYQPGRPVIWAFNFALVALLAIAVSWLTYRLIELPFLRLKGRFR